MPLFYYSTSGKLFTHIAFPVFSTPRNWGAEGSIGLDRFNCLTDHKIGIFTQTEDQ